MQKVNVADEQLLIRYLLGSLPDDQAEPLDASSVSDEDFAARLSAVEHDLVDAYVRGELDGETLARFESWYLSSARRRQRVAFARALLTLEREGRTTAAASEPAFVHPARAASFGRRRLPQWLPLAAVLAIVLTAGYLLVDSFRSQDETNLSERGGQQASVEREVPPAAPGEAPEQRALPPPTTSEAVLPPELRTGIHRVAISVLLIPQTRGAGSIAAVPVPAGASHVTVRLQLEFDEFPEYEAALRDPATDRFLWQSNALRATSEGERRVVSLQLPIAGLEPQNYSLELTGRTASGTAELLGSYPFRAVLE